MTGHRLRRPALLAAAGLLAAGFLALAGWQYGRGEQKERLLEAWQRASVSAPVSMALALREGTPRPVADRFVSESGAGWLLLDNQRSGREVGLRAYRILRSAEGARLLADFGWLAWPSRASLPMLEAPPEPLEVSGLWVDWPGQGIALAPNPMPDDAGEPALLTYLDRAELEAWTGFDLEDGVLRVAPESRFGFRRALDPLPNTLPSEKHYGYALQWFGLALATLVTAALLHRRSLRRID